jgi:transglutaminase-like putative cysteine protease
MKKVVVSIACLLATLTLPQIGSAAIGDVIGEISSPGPFPADVAFHNGAVWVADWEEGLLYELNANSGELRRSVPAPCHHPDGLASDGVALYISDAENQRVYVFDPNSGLTSTSYATPESSPRGLAYGGGSLWLLDDGEDTVYEMVPSDGTILNYYKAPHTSVRGLAHDGKYLWITDRVKDELYAVRPSDGRVVFLVKTYGKFPCGLAFGDGSLWLADFQDKVIRKLSTKADEPYRVTDWVTRDLRYQYLLRNDGEGSIQEGAINLAVPYAALENQELIGEITWNPEPTEMVEDQWGQQVARFKFQNVPTNTAVSAGYQVRVKLGELHYAFYPEDVEGLDKVPKEILEDNLAATSRLQMDQEMVKKTAKEIVGDEENPYWMARKIFDWVNGKLEYKRVGGWDVPTTLIKRGTGSCSEYAFLYIALCRSVGLPARYEGSVVVRGDDASFDDVYHRWCEVYLPGIGWMPVDPSGGDKEWPADQARYFGGLANRFLITTHGSGDSEYLSWNYNGFATYTYVGRGTVTEEAYGVWSPVEEETAAQAMR